MTHRLIAGAILCQHSNGPGQWFALMAAAGVPLVVGIYLVLRSRQLAERSVSRGYRFRPWLMAKRRSETPLLYIAGGTLFAAFGVLILIGSLLQRSGLC